MAESATKLPVRTVDKDPERAPAPRGWAHVEGLRRDLNRLFEDFGDLWRSPVRQALLGTEALWSRDLTWAATPAVDVAEKDKAYEFTAELPGMDEKNIDVKIANGILRSKARRGKRKKKRRRTIISPSVATVLSSAASRCPKESRATRSRQASRRAFLP
jgi:HSP20 family protein